MQFKHATLDFDGPVAILKLDHQEVMNAVSMDMLGFYSSEEGSQKSPLQSIGAFKAPTVADFVGMATILRFRPLSQALDKAMKAASPEIKTVVVDFNNPLAGKTLNFDVKVTDIQSDGR